MPNEVRKREQGRELMDWYDRQPDDTKWRITAYVVKTGEKLFEALMMFRAMDERDSQHRLKLVHSTYSRH